MSKQTPLILLNALLSVVIFIVIFNTTHDLILVFLSTIPLFSVGLGKEPKMALQAGVLATISIALFTNNLFIAVLFFLLFTLPCWYICDRALRRHDIKLGDNLPYMRIWYPIGLITVYLAVYGCILLAIITAMFATQEPNLPQFTTKIIEEAVAVFNKEYGIYVDTSAKYIAFMLCGFTIWLWCILLIGNAWITNRLLSKKNLAKRPDITISVFPIPHWLLTLMSICALASLIGGESMSFLGKSSLIILLMPYFFQGAAIFHANTINFANRRFLLFFFYLIIAVLLWPALVVAGVGLWYHIKIFNKHLSSGGSSSKS